jgi:hypothetical protein
MCWDSMEYAYIYIHMHGNFIGILCVGIQWHIYMHAYDMENSLGFYVLGLNINAYGIYIENSLGLYVLGFNDICL